jgi:hypothetical protein
MEKTENIKTFPTFPRHGGDDLSDAFGQDRNFPAGER